LTPEAAAALLSEETIAATLAHPAFRAVCEADAAAGSDHYHNLPLELRWFARDLGRFGIIISATMLDLIDGLTLQSLRAVSASVETSSLGRVTQLVRRAEAAGLAHVEPGAGKAAQRRLRFDPRLLGIARDRIRIGLQQALALLSSDSENLVAVLNDEALYLQILMNMALVTTPRRDIFGFMAGDPLDYFAFRDAGFLVLYDLLLRQAPDRKRFLEAAPLSRRRLAETFDVSRAHINKLFAGSPFVEASADRVVFHPALSDNFERYLAANYIVSLGAARAVRDGWRFSG